MNNEPDATPEYPRPPALYHASADRFIAKFEPRREKVRDPLEGPVVFATPDKAYASCFIVPSDDSWVKIGRFSTEKELGRWRVVISDPERFAGLDHGGAIYSLPVDSFTSDPNHNLAGIEWTSKVAVRPTSATNYESGLLAMKNFGVEVYFVARDTFKMIQAADDHGREIIEGLIPVP